MEKTTNSPTGELNKKFNFQALYYITHSLSQQVTCFPLYPMKVTTIPLPSNAKETKLGIGWKLLSLGKPNPKTSVLLGKWRHAFFENKEYLHLTLTITLILILTIY